MCNENKVTVREVWIYSYVTVCVGRYYFRQWYVFCEHSDNAIIVVIVVVRLRNNWDSWVI